jgi:hypothetical protein
MLVPETSVALNMPGLIAGTHAGIRPGSAHRGNIPGATSVLILRCHHVTRAALLLAAHNVLRCADIHTELTPLVNPTFTTTAARTSWTRFYQRHRTTTSPRLQQFLTRHSMHAGAN